MKKVRNFQGFITCRELMAALEEEYFVELVIWLVHCAI